MTTPKTLALRAAAQVRKSFGVRGELKIASYSRTEEEYRRLGTVLVGRDERSAQLREIESVKMRGEEIYVKFRGIDDKDAADLLRGHFLFVEESKRKRLPKDKHYIDEIIGCAVKDKSGREYGTVTAVEEYPAQMIYTVRTPSGDVLLPAVPEFIRSMDVEQRTIIVTPPEGLFSGEML